MEKKNLWKYLALSLVGIMVTVLVVLVSLAKQETTKKTKAIQANRPLTLDKKEMIDEEIFEESMADQLSTLKKQYKADLLKMKNDLNQSIKDGNVELVATQKKLSDKLLAEQRNQKPSYPKSPLFDITESRVPSKKTVITSSPDSFKISDNQGTKLRVSETQANPNPQASTTTYRKPQSTEGENPDRFVILRGAVYESQEKDNLTNEIIVKDEKGAVTKVIKKKRTLTIPPSFMEGTLLSGLMAKTLNGASDNPDQMFIRVQAPAFLPNYVKANTTGCFVVAQGTGDLASHRIKTRLISLSCIDNSGRRLIHGNLYGFLSDSDDGKNHLSGVVIHKGGAIISQAMIADFVSSLGGGIETLSKPTLTSASGVIEGNSASGSELVKGAIGSGIQGASKVYSDMLKQLISQATPTIEVGNTKKVVIFVTKPTEIEIFPLVKEESL